MDIKYLTSQAEDQHITDDWAWSQNNLATIVIYILYDFAIMWQPFWQEKQLIFLSLNFDNNFYCIIVFKIHEL